MRDIDLFMPCKGYRMRIGWVSGNDNGVHRDHTSRMDGYLSSDI